MPSDRPGVGERSRSRRILVAVLMWAAAVAAVVLAVPAGRAEAGTLAPGFSDDLVTAVPRPTALAFTPDGRMLVTSQTGQLRVVANGTLVAAPALDLAADICVSNERGLLGVAVDPDFATNRFIYLFWTRKNPICNRRAEQVPVHRVSRFVLPPGNVIDPATETVLLDNILSYNGTHNAGDLAFGPDGLLYVSVGDGGCDYARTHLCGPANQAARDPHVLLGKVLRITRNGAVPPSNPFAGTGGRCGLTGRTTEGRHCQETYLWGLRNPFRIAFDPNAATPRLAVNDVGQDHWEEINLAVPGADYGWNVREGRCVNGSATNCGNTPPGMTDPWYSYSHDDGCESITGGAFVPDGIWPAAYDGAYIYSDYVCGSIFALTSTAGGFDRRPLATGLGASSAVHLRFGPMGSTQALYYTTLVGGGEVRRLSYSGAANRPPTAVLAADPLSGPVPLDVTFDASASSDPDGDPLTYLWDFGDGSAPVQTSGPVIGHRYASSGVVTARVRVRDTAGATSAPAQVTVRPGNEPPVVTITAPLPSIRFTPGAAVTLRATAVDPETGPLPAGNLSWEVIRRHDDHTHPFRPPTPGATMSFPYPDPEDPTDTTSYLEATVTATDAAGATATARIDLRPRDSLVIGDVAGAEGAGTGASTTVLVPVTLRRQVCGSTCGAVTVRYATRAGTAGAADVVPASGLLRFEPGETTRTIALTVLDDAAAEGDERLSVVLRSPSAGAALADAVGEVLVLDDERAPALPVMINAGGPALVAGGVGWLADQSYTGGTTLSTTGPIAATTDDPLYRRQRVGATGYHVIVPDGTYRVRIHTAEIGACCAQPGRRVFDVAAEGTVVLDAFDIAGVVGPRTARVEERVVVVNDGVLNLTFRPRMEAPVVAAIEILPGG